MAIGGVSAPSSAVVHNLVGAQENSAARPQASVKVDSPRAVSALAQGDYSNPVQPVTRREPDDHDESRPKPRGSLVDLLV